MKTRISAILKEKGEKTFSVKPETTVFDAVSLMAEKKIKAVLVMAQDQILGIFTEHDYIGRVTLRDLSPKETPVKDVMTGKVAFVTPDTLIEEGLAVMTEKECRHLPVLDNRNLAGLVSMGDLVKRIIKDQKVTIKSLTEYIALSY